MCLALPFWFGLVFLLWSGSIKTPNISNNVPESVRTKQYYSVFGMMSNRKCAVCTVEIWRIWHLAIKQCTSFHWRVSKWMKRTSQPNRVFVLYYYVQIPRTESHSLEFSIYSTYLHLTCRVRSTKMRDILWMRSQFFCCRLKKKNCPFFPLLLFHFTCWKSVFFSHPLNLNCECVVHAYYFSHQSQQRWEMQCDNLGVVYVKLGVFGAAYKTILEECVLCDTERCFVIWYT